MMKYWRPEEGSLILQMLAISKILLIFPLSEISSHSEEFSHPFTNILSHCATSKLVVFALVFNSLMDEFSFGLRFGDG